MSDIITSIEEYIFKDYNIDAYGNETPAKEYGYEICTNEYSVRLTIDNIHVGPFNHYDVIINHEDTKKFIGSKIISWNEERIKFNDEMPEDSEIFKLTNNKNICEAVILTVNTSVGEFKIIGFIDFKKKDYDYPFMITKVFF